MAPKKQVDLKSRLEAAVERGFADLAEGLIDQGFAAARSGLLGHSEITPYPGDAYSELGLSPGATEAEARQALIFRAKQEFQRLYRAYMQVKGANRGV
jgi:hypothetical protein